jgi:CPA1 family monovalent cation:H+ antiporter
MWSSFDVGSLLFVMAAVIGVVNERWLGLPRPIALLLGALAASLGLMAVSALLPFADLASRSEMRIRHADLSGVLLNGVLALLLFAASLQVDLGELRKRAAPIFTLATVGVMIATLAFGLGIWGLFALAGAGVPLVWCLVLGAILAPTDAIAVEQLLHRVKLPDDLKALISGESLFNDGAAVVLFFAALAAAKGDAAVIGHGRLLFQLVLGGLGGAVVGAMAGMAANAAIRAVRDDHLVITISLALVLATYRVAVWLDVSGPIAVVVAGLVLRNWRRDAKGPDGWRQKLTAFWSMGDELVNTLLFLLMGFELLAIPVGAAGWLPVLGAIPLALAARFVSVGLPMAALPAHRGRKLPAIGVLTWTGLRGGISLALVLALPETPFRDALAVVCYAVVIFTVVVQGLSTPRVVDALYGRRG